MIMNNAKIDKKNSIFLIIIFFISIIIYYNAKNVFFVADDFFYIFNRNNLEFYSPLTEFFYQPVTFAVYYLNYFWAGLSAAKYHLFSIVLNAVNNILLFYIVYHLVKNKLYAFIICLLSAVYYFSADNMIWINCTNNVICGFFYFLTILFSIKFNESKKNFFLLLLIISMILTLYSREMGASIFFILLLVDITFYRKELKNRIFRKYIYIFIIFFLYILLMLLGPSLRYKTLSFNRGNYEFVFSIKSIIININWFLFRTFIPFSFGSHCKIPFVINITLFIRFFYISIIFVILAAFIVRNRFYYFGVLWIIFTSSTYLPLNIYYVFNGDRYFYLPHIGLGFILLGFWIHFKKYFANKPFLYYMRIFVILFILLYSVGSIYAINQRINWWKNAGNTSKNFISVIRNKFTDISEDSILFIKNVPRWTNNAPNKLIVLINGTEFALRLYYNKKNIAVIPYWADFGKLNYERIPKKNIFKQFYFLEYENNNLIDWQPDSEYISQIENIMKLKLRR